MKITGTIAEVSSRFLLIEYDGDSQTAEKIKELSEDSVLIDLSKPKGKRSISANGYFWVLVDRIARKLKTDRSSVYKWLLKEGGVFVPLSVDEEAIGTLEKSFSFIEETGRTSNGSRTMVDVNCFFGSSTFNTAEMARLIDIARQAALDVGAEVEGF